MDVCGKGSWDAAQKNNELSAASDTLMHERSAAEWCKMQGVGAETHSPGRKKSSDQDHGWLRCHPVPESWEKGGKMLSSLNSRVSGPLKGKHRQSNVGA